MMQDVSINLQRQGITIEKYMEMTGGSVEELEAQMRPQAESQIKTRLVLDAIAKEEKLSVDDKEVDEQLAKMAQAYHRDVEELKGQMTAEHREMIRQDLVLQKAASIIIESSLEA